MHRLALVVLLSCGGNHAGARDAKGRSIRMLVWRSPDQRDRSDDPPPPPED
jgi:hypothetical protein